MCTDVEFDVAEYAFAYPPSRNRSLDYISDLFWCFILSKEKKTELNNLSLFPCFSLEG